ncbi:MAG: hypothetical protein ACD_21C00266G0005 [uncultured bacterium]|nr:MAG: hypothetical protein ACD_21C00266G0005 [uncultured bacterium]
MKIKYFLLTVIICIIYAGTAMAYNVDVDWVRDVTGGQGVFKVTINNHRDRTATTTVGVMLAGSADEYGDLSQVFGCSQKVTIDAHSSIQTLLIKPLVGYWPDYQGDGPKLIEGSKVVVCLGAFIQGKIVYYSAEYVPGTKFIEVPDTIFDIT